MPELKTFASFEVIRLLRKLSHIWQGGGGEIKNKFYLQELLPELKERPEKGTNEERIILVNIKSIASSDEWDNLGEILANLDQYSNYYHSVSSQIDQYIHNDDCDEANAYVASLSPNDVLKELLNSKLDNAIRRKFSSSLKALENYNIDKADDLFNEIKTSLSKVDILNYKRCREDSLEKLVETNIKEIQNALSVFKFAFADSLYSQISKWWPEVEYNRLVYKAKKEENRQIQKRELEKKIHEIKRFLEKYRFHEADVLYKQVKDVYPLTEYKKLSTYYQKKQFKEQLDKPLSSCNFILADQLYKFSSTLSLNEYIEF